ncbi:hypothetical protein [Thermocatellispora tengchongensis]|uniref:hypothetical protein n=1 Tax=Thermocatellispora tengchongensis TaxID=1073253 RepID=UPI0036458FDD
MTDHNIEQRGERAVPRRVAGTPTAGAPMLGGPEERDGERDRPGVVPQDERQARRAEKIVVLCFTTTSVAALAFVVFYVTLQVGSPDATGLSNLALGGSLTLAVLALAVGVVVWARQIMPKYTLTQERHPMVSDEEDRAAVAEYFVQGANESGFVRRKLLRRALLPAMAALGLVPLVLLRDLDNTKTAGANAHKRLRHTVWGRGPRMADGPGWSWRARASRSGRPTSTAPAACSPWCPRATSTT